MILRTFLEMGGGAFRLPMAARGYSAGARHKGYEFIDCANSQRLEYFGGVKVIRTCPVAVDERSSDWGNPDLIYNGSSGKNGTWSLAQYGGQAGRATWGLDLGMETTSSAKDKGQDKGQEGGGEAWTAQLDSLVFRLSAGAMGQIGVFPEQRGNWSWIREVLSARQQELCGENYLEADACSTAERPEQWKHAESEQEGTAETPSGNSSSSSSSSINVLNAFAYTGGSTMAAVSVPGVKVMPLNCAVLNYTILYNTI
jgi:hypothetical protein